MVEIEVLETLMMALRVVRHSRVTSAGYISGIAKSLHLCREAADHIGDTRMGQ